MRTKEKGATVHSRARRILLPATVLALVAWMAVIFAFSAQPDTKSAEVSAGVGYRIAAVWDKVFRLEQSEQELRLLAERIDYPVRKGAHMSEYGILALLFFALIACIRWQAAGSGCLLALFLAFLYACTDEFHQRFVPGRSGSFTDVMIDTSGAAAAMLFVFLVMFAAGKARRRKQKVKTGF